MALTVTVDTDFRHQEDGDTDGNIYDVWSDLSQTSDEDKTRDPVKKMKKVNILRKALKEMVLEQRTKEQEVTNENPIEANGHACQSEQPKVTRNEVKMQGDLSDLTFIFSRLMIKIINI